MKRFLVISLLLLTLYPAGANAQQVYSRAWIVDFFGQPTPSAPPTNFGRVYFDQSSQTMKCVTSTGADCWGGGSGNAAFNAITSGTNTTAAMVMDSGASLSSTNIGQIAGTQMWSVGGMVAPTFSATQTGGSLGNGQNLIWAYTFNTAAGETTPSPSVSNSPSNIAGSTCVSGGACTATMIAPSLPTGYTGYTVYFCDISAAVGCTLPKKVPACTNITGNCLITSPALPSSTDLPTVNTAYVQPPNLQASECPPGVIPNWFVQTVDGNWHTQGGVDPISNNISPAGTQEICRRTFFTDAKTTPVGFNNSFVAMQHTAGTGTSITNQDRTLGLSLQNPAGDTATRYGLEVLQAEMDLVGTPTFNGSPDGEVSAGSFQTSFAPTANIATTLGSNAVRAYFTRATANAAVDTGGMHGLAAYFVNNSTVSGGSSYGDAIRASCGGSVAGSAIGCAIIRFFTANTGQFPSGMYGIFNTNNASFVPAGSDALIRNDQKNWPAVLGVKTYLQELFPTSPAVLDTPGNFKAGGLTAIQQTAPTISAPNCTGGASQYTYKWVFIDSNGGSVAGGAISTGSTCVNPLTSGNPATFTVPTVLNGPGTFDHVDLYRTGGPMGFGKIGCIGKTGSGCTWILPDGVYNPTLGLASGGSLPTVSDTGLTADGASAPTANTTGGVTAAGYSLGTLNTVFVASDFTTAANTNLQTITGLTWNLPATAMQRHFACDLTYSQATAAAAVAFGIQAATNNPTNIYATGTQQITVGPPATYVSGTLATLATTTATSILSGTPGATATNYTVHLAGFIENPAVLNAINIMVSTATSGDAVTVLRGSSCTLLP